MDLLKIVRSFEEFLFEVLTWLYFYPRTLLRIVTRPLAAMAYSDAEIQQAEDERYDDSLSPPVLLMITLGLIIAVGWVTHATMPANSAKVVATLYHSKQNLLLVRCLLFSLPPLIAALTLLRHQKIAVSRASLRAPFYAQCYLAAPFALGVSLGGVLAQLPGVTTSVAGGVIALAATVWLLAAQTRWFAQTLSIGMGRAALIALGAFLRSLLYLLAILTPIALV